MMLARKWRQTIVSLFRLPLHTHRPQANKGFVKPALLYMVLGSTVISLGLILHYYLSVSSQQKNALHQEQISVDLIEQALAENLANMAADAKNFAFISHSLMSLPLDDRIHTLQQYFLQFSQHQGDYSQIRLLDKKGRELVRVNHQGDVYEVVKAAELQDKSQRYYFQKSRQLAQGQVYISPLDQNMEGGKPQRPITPTIRVSSPVYHGGDLAGVVVLNYRALPLIQQLLRLSPSFLKRLYIINSDGAATIEPLYRLEQETSAENLVNSPILEEDLLHYLDHQGRPNAFRFIGQSDIPHEVQILLDQEQGGRIVNPDNYLTFATRQAPDQRPWFVISSFSKAYFAQIQTQFIRQYGAFYALLYLFMLFLCGHIALNQARLKQQAEQQASELQFRQTLADIPLLAVSINHKGQVVFCNSSFLKRVAYEEFEVLGKDWIQLFIPLELRPQVRVALAQALCQGHKQWQFKDVIQDKKGLIHLIDWTSTARRHSLTSKTTDNTATLTLIGEDVTLKEQTQQQLKQLNHAVEQSQNSVIITGLDGKIIYVNPTFCQISGYQEAEVLGLSPKFLQSGQTKAKDYDALWQILLAGNEWRGELCNRKKDGSFFWEKAIISPVKDADGHNLYYVAVKQDISHEKQLSQALEQAKQQRVQHEKLAAIGKVVSMIAHDLRNPLSSIKMVLQMYQRKNPDELCQISLRQVGYMEAILEDLLTYSKPEEKQAQWLDVNKFLQQLMLSQEKLAKEHKVLIELQLASNLPRLHADPVKLKQALQNIVVNGIQASHQDAHQAKLIIRSYFSECMPHQTPRSNAQQAIEPQGNNQQPGIIIEIINTGEPIAASLTQQAFEPFFTTKASGTGLGLAISKGIIERHDGMIQLMGIQAGQETRDPTLKGTCVRIGFPTTQTSSPSTPSTNAQDSYEQATNL